jgi:hypothetical protein
VKKGVSKRKKEVREEVLFSSTLAAIGKDATNVAQEAKTPDAMKLLQEDCLFRGTPRHEAPSHPCNIGSGSKKLI